MLWYHLVWRFVGVERAQPKLRDFKVYDGDLGSYTHPATVCKKGDKWVKGPVRGAVPVSMRLSEGDKVSSKYHGPLVILLGSCTDFSNIIYGHVGYQNRFKQSKN